MRAWLFQDSRQKKKLGAKAPWSVGWYDPEGKKRSRRIGSKSLAEKFRRKIEGELAAGVYKSTIRKKWADFRREYEEKELPRLEPTTRDSALVSFRHFERIIAPVRMDAINSRTIDAYVAKRSAEQGAKRESVVSKATINRELRHLKAALNVAHDWRYLNTVPKIRLLKEAKRVPRYVTPEHFAAIYQATDNATRPKCSNCTTGEWWRALLVTAYMTGWRLGELLSLRRDHVDLEAGVAVLVAEDTKGKRGERLPLHPVVVEHLQCIADFRPLVFYIDLNRRFMWEEFNHIQVAAKIHLPCDGRHKHTPRCHTYGFHDLRRAFATLNAEKLSADALQVLMRHKSYQTTQRYINTARQLNRAVDGLHVPDVLKRKNG